LAAAPAIESTFFTPPEGAKESVNCLSPVKHPTLVYNPDPKPPRTSDGRTLVVLNIVVGTDGKPHDLRVTSAPNRDFDEAALEAVRQWTFKPATCDGEPVGVQIAVDVNFP
jgi:periplasmic protein TonB